MARSSALAGYEHQRNQEVLPMFEFTTQLARLEPPAPEMMHLMNSLRGNEIETGRFLGIVAGTVPIPEFFAPDNLTRIIEASALKPAA